MEIGLAFGLAALIGIFDVIFLDAGGVFEKDGGEFAGSGSTEDLAGEAVLDQFGDKAAMVDMCMGEDEVVDLSWREAPVSVEDVGLKAHALEHAAVEQVFLSITERDEVLRPGNDAGGAMECNLHRLYIRGECTDFSSGRCFGSVFFCG